MNPVFPSGDGLEISPADTATALADGAALVIDVREPYEREAGHIDGTRHIELERLASQSDSIPKDTPVIFYCRVGARSAMAAQAFQAAGFQARSMAGGITAWDAEGRPLVPEDGVVADH
ncbi:MAG TPA: rhodanese-like domain-containing protein [Solirubrobacteraceae bacterium]